MSPGRHLIGLILPSGDDPCTWPGRGKSPFLLPKSISPDSVLAVVGDVKMCHIALPATRGRVRTLPTRNR